MNGKIVVRGTLTGEQAYYWREFFAEALPDANAEPSGRDLAMPAIREAQDLNPEAADLPGTGAQKVEAIA